MTMMRVAYAAAFALLLISLGYGFWTTRQVTAARDACHDVSSRGPEAELRPALAACSAWIETGGKALDLARTLGQRGFIRLRLRDFAGAIKDLDQAIRLEPDGEQAYLHYYNRGEVRRIQGALSQALPDYDLALEREPYYVEALLARALTYSMLRQPERGLEDYKQAANLLPENDLRREMGPGYALMMARRCKEALPYFQRAMKLQPKNAQPHLWTAQCLMQLDRPQEALASVDRAIPLSRGPQPFLMRSSIHESLKRPDAVVADMKQALARSPDAPGLLNDLCWSRAIWGQELKEALENCNRAVAARPKEMAFVDSRGFVYFRMGNYPAAIADYDTALRLRAKSPTSLYIRGLAKRALRDTEDGNRDIQAAKAIMPGVADYFAQRGVRP